MAKARNGLSDAARVRARQPRRRPGDPMENRVASRAALRSDDLAALHAASAARSDRERVKGFEHARRAVAPVALATRELDENSSPDELVDGAKCGRSSHAKLALHQR